MRTRADVLLVARGLFESRAKARAAIDAGGVIVGGRRVGKASELVDADAPIEASPAHAWVGRGALKLVHALELWPVAVADKVVLDVGASTGGFTQVCLARGARRVYAVDVGRSQLHPTLRDDARVVSLEATDARDLTSALITEPPALIVTDVSFISLAKALPAALGLTRCGAELVALVKPQFEVGPDKVGKGGLVADPEVRVAALRSVVGMLEAAGWPVRGQADSPILGGDGAHEFLVWARRA